MTDEEKAAAEAVEKAAAGQKTGEGAADQKGDKTVPITAMLEERKQRQAMEARVKALESHFGDQFTYDTAGNVVPRQQHQQQQRQAPVQVPGGDDIQKQLSHLWETDPRRAVQTEMSMAFDWYDKASSALEDQLDEVGKKHADFAQYRSQVRQYLRQLPMDQRSKPGIAESAYFLQKGRDVDSVIARERDEWNKRIQAGESIQSIPAGAGGADSGGERRFTKDEISIAAMYNMKPEEYFKK